MLSDFCGSKLFLSVASLLTISFCPATNNTTTAPQACNGSPALCDRSFSNVSFIGSHDSAFVGTNVADNQNVNLTDQLDAGIRFLQAQTHNDGNGTLSMCHTACGLLNAGPLSDYLGTVKTWMDANADEVVMLLLVNGDRLGVGNFSEVFNSTGLQEYAFVPMMDPLPLEDWPTLGELISSGKRLIVLLDSRADLSIAPFIHDEFSYYFETPYDVTDPSFPECSIDRPSNATANGRMYIVNHFLDKDVGNDIEIPDKDAAPTTNAATGNGSIGAQNDICIGLYGRQPNGVLVDWFDKGDVFAAQRTMNGL